MSLAERIDQKSKALVKREPLTLPRTGESVVVRGLMSGELMRVNAVQDEAQQGVLMVALCTEDPEAPGVPLWNPNDLNGLQRVRDLHIDDLTAIITKQNEVSGTAKTDAQVLGN